LARSVVNRWFGSSRGPQPQLQESGKVQSRATRTCNETRDIFLLVVQCIFSSPSLRCIRCMHTAIANTSAPFHQFSFHNCNFRASCSDVAPETASGQPSVLPVARLARRGIAGPRSTLAEVKSLLVRSRDLAVTHRPCAIMQCIKQESAQKGMMAFAGHLPIMGRTPPPVSGSPPRCRSPSRACSSTRRTAAQPGRPWQVRFVHTFVNRSSACRQPSAAKLPFAAAATVSGPFAHHLATGTQLELLETMQSR